MATYYVATTGNDGDAGDEAHPWLTINHAATTAVGGDTVYFEDGTWTITGVENAWTDGAGSYITFEAVNHGDVVWELGDSDWLVELDTVGHIKFVGIVFEGDTSVDISRLITLTDCDHITFDDCEVKNTQAHGIMLDNCSDITIQDCEIHLETNWEVTGHTSEGIQVYLSCSDILIDGCEIYHTSHNGIKFGIVDGGTIQNCNVHDTSSHAISLGNDQGYGASDNLVVQDNVVKRAGSWRLTPTAKRAIYLSGEVGTVDIRRNVVIESDGPGISLRSNCPGPINVYNNVFYQCQNAYGTHGYDWGSVMMNVQPVNYSPTINFKNNIVYHNQNTEVLYVESGMETNLDADYNLLYSTSSEACRRNSVDYADFEAYQAAGFDPHSLIDQDPLFNAAGSDDFTLHANSPAIDEGVDVGLSYNGPAPDIGAHETSGAAAADYGFYSALWLMGIQAVPGVTPPEVISPPAPVLYPSYKLRFYNTSGQLVAEVTDFLELAYAKRVNEPGQLAFVLAGDHGAISQLTHRAQIEVWRRNARQSLDWYADFRGLFLDQERSYTDRPYFLGNCPGQMIMLSWRHVMWYSGTTNRSTFSSQPGESIMKNLVDYNCCANATTGNGRVRDGIITGLSIQADASGGNSLDWNCAWKNVLSQLQSVARVGGGDFDLIKIGDASWQFRFYAGQRGSDRSSSVIFSLGRGNMARPRYRFDRTKERTVAVVGGKGAGAARATVARTGDDYSATNDIEMFVDARSCSTTAGLQTAGDMKLAQARARREFSFDVLQTPSCLYGLHYCENGELGDLVTARYDNIEVTQKIAGVTVALRRDGQESITVETETV